MSIDFCFSDEEEAFRQRIRTAIREHLPASIRAKVAEERIDLPRADQAAWHKIMHDLGWGGQGLPAQAGGPGWTDAEYFIFCEEIGLADAPRPMLYGLRMVAHTLLAYGTPEQKARFLPGILTGETFWCQGFSEPNAGSDLASLSCRADLVDGRYVLNGAKTWISDAHHADFMFGLFRSERLERKQQGITCLAVDLAAPGVTIRPLPTYDGTHECNEVFFDQVEVAIENRIGAHGDGWSIAKFLLGVERFDSAETTRSRATIARIKAFLAREHQGELPLAHDPLLRRRLAELEVELDALAATEARYVLGQTGDAAVGAEASLLKLRGTEIQQDILELQMDLCGEAGQAFMPDLEEPQRPNSLPESRFAAKAFHRFRATTIYAGSSEIQKNIIAKAVLGLG